MMDELDIGRLFEILMEYQALSPWIARAVLERILEILGELDGRGEGCVGSTEESRWKE